MLTATMTITAPDRESLVECIDLVTTSVAAGNMSYEDTAEGAARIRYRIAEGDTFQAVPVAVDYDVVEEYGISPVGIDAIIGAIMQMVTSGSMVVAEITTQTVIGWLLSEINARLPESSAEPLWTLEDGPLHRYTVTHLTEQYERWEGVPAPSRQALSERLEEGDGIALLGPSRKQDTTSSIIDIDCEDGGEGDA